VIGSVRTTYRGYTLIIDDRHILAVAPNGDTQCQPSMSTIRRWVNKHSRSAGREPHTELPIGVDAHTLSPPRRPSPPNTTLESGHAPSH
jgi:hypothetical protein